MKKNLYLLLFLISLFMLPYVVNADDVVSCDYGDSGLKFEYSDSNSTPKVISDFVTGKKYFNFLGIIETGKEETVTEHIDMNQEWYALYHETPCACPTKLYVCTKTLYSVNLPTIKGRVGTFAVNFLEMLDGFAKWIDLGGEVLSKFCILDYCPFEGAASWDLSDYITDDLIDAVGEHAYAMLTLDYRNLYILTEEEYKKSEIYKKNEKGFRIFGKIVSNDSINIYLDNLETRCGPSGCEFWSWQIILYMATYVESYYETLYKYFTEDQLGLINIEEIECKTVDYIGECDTFDVNCDFFDEDKISYEFLITEYNNCDNDKECKSKVLNKISYLEQKISAKCDKILKNYLYSETQKECIKKCVDLSHILNEWKKGSDLYQEKLGQNNNNKCRMSERLVSWLMKIIEWIRYIVPTLLIILSIIEFIKAIASDSEDEIRKAGSRFVKRLIVAALIFVLPLILEFLLGIFNIPVKDYCLK